MYAVVQKGRKQYKVKEGELLKVEKVEGEVGAAIEFDQVLLLVNNGVKEVGRPFLSNIKVGAEIVEQGRAEKIVVFKSRRRKGYKKKRGHRQPYTCLKITKIEVLNQ